MGGDGQVRLLRAALEQVPDGALLDRVVRASAPMLEVTGVAAALMSEDGGGSVVASSDRVGRDLVDLDFELGEGPSSEAFRTDAEVLVGDVGNGGAKRWPAFSIAARERGIAAAFAFPARVGAIRIGVLVAHRDQAGSMDGELVADARVFTEVCSTLMMDHDAGLDGDPLLAIGWPNRAVIHQATGMVAVQLSAPLPIALARLRAYAFAEGRTLEAVSQDVVERRLRMDE